MQSCLYSWGGRVGDTARRRGGEVRSAADAEVAPVAANGQRLQAAGLALCFEQLDRRRLPNTPANSAANGASRDSLVVSLSAALSRRMLLSRRWPMIGQPCAGRKIGTGDVRGRSGGQEACCARLLRKCESRALVQRGSGGVVALMIEDGGDTDGMAPWTIDGGGVCASEQ